MMIGSFQCLVQILFCLNNVSSGFDFVLACSMIVTCLSMEDPLMRTPKWSILAITLKSRESSFKAP